jgi:hypothetical protein
MSDAAMFNVVLLLMLTITAIRLMH